MNVLRYKKFIVMYYCRKLFIFSNIKNTHTIRAKRDELIYYHDKICVMKKIQPIFRTNAKVIYLRK